MTYKLCIFFLFFIRMCCSTLKAGQADLVWKGSCRLQRGSVHPRPGQQDPCLFSCGPVPPGPPTQTSPSFRMGSRGLSIKKEDTCSVRFQQSQEKVSLLSNPESSVALERQEAEVAFLRYRSACGISINLTVPVKGF